MKTSLEWLHDFLPGPPVDPDAAAEALTHGGFPVEAIDRLAGPRHAGDAVLDVEVTSNRGDCLSHVGVARELSALLNRAFQNAEPGAAQSQTPASSVTSVRIDAPDLCPHYVARVVRGVTIRPSPPWLARRLEAVGLPVISNVVDVTNYVMFEMGQPLHAFDFDRLEGRRIVVRRANPGEKVVTIDGRERPLKPEMLVIADAARAVALAGVMGGAESEVSATTVNILLESARFDPLSVRKTARALAMKSDSSYRFERGIDPALPERASLRAAQLILETAGGDLLSGSAAAGAAGFVPKILTLRLAKLRQVLGVDLPVGQVVDALSRLQLAPRPEGEVVTVTVPSHRLDLNIEVDLVEEVARVVGYDKIPVRDEIAIRLNPPDPSAEVVETVCSTLVGAGFFESVTFSFVSDLLVDDFAPQGRSNLLRADPTVRGADAFLRPSLLPGLLESVYRNESAGTAGARLYEIGSTFRRAAQGQPGDGAGDNVEGRVDERRRLALVGGPDWREMRGAVEALLHKLDPNKPVKVVPDTHPGFAAAASGRVEWGGRAVGHIGKIDRAIAEKLSLRDIPAAAELDMQALLAGAQRVPQLRPPPRFPAAERDLSLVLPEVTRYEALESVILKAQPRWLESLEYVTTYRGKQAGEGRKSVTVKLIFRSPTETLTSEQADASANQAVEAARRELGAELRG
jgi:phenylalanyl-tRNA synthetase beta chain